MAKVPRLVFEIEQFRCFAAELHETYHINRYSFAGSLANRVQHLMDKNNNTVLEGPETLTLLASASDAALAHLGGVSSADSAASLRVLPVPRGLGGEDDFVSESVGASVVEERDEERDESDMDQEDASEDDEEVEMKGQGGPRRSDAASASSSNRMEIDSADDESYDEEEGTTESEEDGDEEESDDGLTTEDEDEAAMDVEVPALNDVPIVLQTRSKKKGNRSASSTPQTRRKKGDGGSSSRSAFFAKFY